MREWFPSDLHLLSMIQEDLLDISEYVQKKTDNLASKIHIINTTRTIKLRLMVSFSQKEVEFLNKMEECRVATCHSNIPHVKPVSYLYEEGVIFIATDYDTRMYKNILENPKAALSIDIYKDKGHKAICIQGDTTIIEKGDRFSRIYKKFHERFEWVRTQPWEENEAPFIKIIPIRKSSWGLE